MSDYRHHVSGFYAQRDDAASALSTLVERGIARAQMQIFETNVPTAEPAPKEDSNAVLKDVIVDGAIGTAVGTGLGALAEVALVAANVSLFVVSPVLAPLAMLGWGAGLGGLLGAAIGAKASPAAGAGKKEGWLSELVRDAIASGQIVLMVQTRNAHETAMAREVIEASVGDVKDIPVA